MATHSLSLPLSFRLSGSALKVLAVVSMVADHCACFMLEQGSLLYEVLRCIGRIAFPVFALLIAEGFAHTRDRMRYFLTLLAVGIVSELPWQLLNGADGTHNVMFTLALGVVALSVFDRLCEHGIVCFIGISTIAAIAWWIGSDYEWRGIFMIVIFYMLRRQTIEPWLTRGEVCYPLQSMLQIALTLPLMSHYGVVGAILASFAIFLYDGTRGSIKGAAAKYRFYAFYPVHLVLLYLTI